MAAIDKIYVNTEEQYLQFKEWCEKQPKLKDKYGKEVSLTSYLFTYWTDWSNGGRPIFCAPYYVDAYVIRNCPLNFIQEELKINYGEWTQDQIEIDNAYKIVMERGGSKGGEFYWWLDKNDFKIVNGVITMPNKEKSDYQLIKEGKLYTSPFTSYQYEIGKHFKCIKHPLYYYNRALKCKYWFVDINTPKDLPFLRYNKKYNSWDFSDEFVESDSCSTCVKHKTIRAVKRDILKWKLPVGSIVRCTGRYIGDTYEFKITR